MKSGVDIRFILPVYLRLLGKAKTKIPYTTDETGSIIINIPYDNYIKKCPMSEEYRTPAIRAVIGSCPATVSLSDMPMWITADIRVYREAVINENLRALRNNFLIKPKRKDFLVTLLKNCDECAIIN